MSIVSVRGGTPSGGAHLVQILKGVYITLIRLRHAHNPNRGAKKSSNGLANIPGHALTKITSNETIWKNKTRICGSTYFADFREKIISVEI